ncbi:uncharacterized protein KY384_008207 [Bacidia gigantensis]|uniref:uncharacterized protein n=1 Tax=Bacidia gigantensis TaxID=2732470 RepID=UPI001D0544F4|nr:uncharacterized protein KY384_008207 [Bacidia gigantensis]KAG8526778.1 hypothetical protein KY384_008207 [Bacidia gigantensis]
MATTLQRQDEWAQFLHGEKARAGFVEQLLNDFESAQKKLLETEEELDREKENTKNWHKRFKEVNVELENKNHDLFLDSFIQAKELGGQEAARMLRDCASDYVRRELPQLHQKAKVLVRVYCNFKGLSKRYCELEILQDADGLARFARGFNMGDPLCDFVDAGSGKECSDHKLRELFELHVGQMQCKHIIFGGSADNGYARLFGPYSNNIGVRNRVTLLEGAPFAAEMVYLANKYRKTSFKSIFREEKIPTRRVSFSTTPPKSVSPKPSTWADTARVNSTEWQYDVTRATTPPSLERTDGVFRNGRGQRVDVPIKVSPTLVSQMKPKKLCNLHYLAGVCNYSDCKHSHSESLDGKKLDALRVVARLAPCSQGLYCDDELCFSGHRCPRDPCINGDGRCWFPLEMHNVDTKIVT